MFETKKRDFNQLLKGSFFPSLARAHAANEQHGVSHRQLPRARLQDQQIHRRCALQGTSGTTDQKALQLGETERGHVALTIDVRTW
jgi:hypothetical protein